MPKPEFKFERSIVSIWIDGTAKGTGFVIGRGKVLTCAHVVVDEDDQPGSEKCLKKKIEIEFYAVRVNQSPAQATILQRVTIDTNHFSPKAEHDIAVLTWDADLPVEVNPARFSFEEELSNRSIRTRGYPFLSRYHSQPGVGTFRGLTEDDASGEPHWTLNSKEITGGFSGAPLIDVKTERVIGMAKAIIRVTDTDFRNMETAIGIRVQTIQEVCKDLLPLSEEQSTFEFATSYLEENLIAFQFFRELILATSPEQLSAAKIVERLLGAQDPLQTLFDALEAVAENPQSFLHKGKGLSDEQNDAIWQICDYATCLLLPKRHVERISRQLSRRKIDAGTKDRQLVVVHLANAFNIPRFHGGSVTDTSQTIFDRRNNRMITTDDETIRLMGGSGTEAGTGADRTSTASSDDSSSNFNGYQQQFIRGIAYQLRLPGANTESLDFLLDQIKLRFANLKAKGRDGEPVVAVLLTEPRDNDVEKLNEHLKDLYFIQLPLYSDRDYAAIIMYRDDIGKITNQFRRTSDG